MRIRLLNLLMIFPAWVLAYYVAPAVDFQSARISYRHVSAINDMRAIRLVASTLYIDDVDMEFGEYDVGQIWAQIEKDDDPWGNKYQLVEGGLDAPDGIPTIVHVYSFGEDGVSHSQGNDIDDINSWSDKPAIYYSRQIENEHRRENLWKTIWLTPIMFVAIWFIVGTFETSHRIAQ